MRNTILGAVAGLLVGSVGALAYSHFFGDGSLLADLQAKLDAANAALAKVTAKQKELAEETTSLSSQVDQLQASNDELKHPADSAPAPPPTAPQMDIGAIAGALRDMFRGGGGFRNPQQRMFLLQTRLKLSSEQAAKINAAMQADMKARRELMQQMWQNGGKVDPAAAAAADTLDPTLQAVLNPEQQREYAQLQTDEKNARADTAANSQVNSFGPLLQLSDAQKDQVYSALYQAQLSAPDPTSLLTNPNAAAALVAQNAATQAALQKVLTPDQLTLYQQEQSMNGGPRNRGGGNNTAGGGNNGGAQATAASSPPAPGSYATVTPQVAMPGGAITNGAPTSGWAGNSTAPVPAGTVTSVSPPDGSTPPTATTSTNAAPATTGTTSSSQ